MKSKRWYTNPGPIYADGQGEYTCNGEPYHGFSGSIDEVYEAYRTKESNLNKENPAPSGQV